MDKFPSTQKSASHAWTRSDLLCMFFYQLRLTLAASQYGPGELFQNLSTHAQEATALKDQKLPARSRHQPKHNGSAHAPPTPISTKRTLQRGHEKNSSTARQDFRRGNISIESIQGDQVVSTTKCGSGILHLYRETQSVDIPTVGPVYLCVLAIPTYMQSLDFVSFCGTFVESYRIIRDHTPNKYLAVLKFATPDAANEFHRRYNGKQFSVMEPELCHVVYVRNDASIEALELPTCPVCLERMDESVTGLSNIQCEHTFQCSCLSKWGDGQYVSCPACNYSVKPVLEEGSSRKTSKPVPREKAQCFVCGSTESLWICMVCGHIGCGRYHDAHAHDHYMETGDSYALEIETQRIWDYTGDRYIHRLIQNMVDGSLVELPSATFSSSANTSAAASGTNLPSQASHKQESVSPEKLDSMSVEYTYMLTSQLESQRMHYEEQLSQIQIQISSLTAQIKGLMLDVKNAEKERDEYCEREAEIRRKAADTEKEKTKLERKIDGWKSKCRDKEREWHEEQELAASLLRNNELLKKDAAEKEKIVDELSSQVSALMTLLENNGSELT